MISSALALVIVTLQVQVVIEHIAMKRSQGATRGVKWSFIEQDQGLGGLRLFLLDLLITLIEAMFIELVVADLY